jgi:hypothetical protein
LRQETRSAEPDRRIPCQQGICRAGAPADAGKPAESAALRRIPGAAISENFSPDQGNKSADQENALHKPYVASSRLMTDAAA